MPLVAGVDSSTQSTKVEVRDADDGTLISRGRAPHPATTPPRSEQHPSSWWDALIDAFRQCGQRRIAAVSVAGQQHGMVVMGGSGEVLRAAKLWNDTESATQAASLLEALGPARWAELSGTVPVASFTITKLLWLKENEPNTFDKLAHVVLPHDWLTFQLTGNLTTDRGDASGTGYWSPAEDKWQLQLLDLVDTSVDWSERLPQILGPIDSAGSVIAEATSQMGIEPGAIVGPGTGDNMAAALGIGLRRGDVAISLGTSGTVFALSSHPTADASGLVAGFADATGNFLPLVCTLNCTKVTDAFARLLSVDHRAFDQLVLQAPPGSGGLVLVPYLDGERTPNRPDATGVLSGVRSDVSREQIARSAVEGVVCGLLDGFDALSNAGVETSEGRIMLVGGGARSAAYRRVVADLLGRPVVVPDQQEHVATGGCIQAAAVLQRRQPAEVAVAWGLGKGTTVEPDESVEAGEIRARYAAARA